MYTKYDVVYRSLISLAQLIFQISFSKGEIIHTSVSEGQRLLKPASYDLIEMLSNLIKNYVEKSPFMEPGRADIFVHIILSNIMSM